MFFSFGQNNFQKLNAEAVSQTELRQAISMAEKLLIGQKSGDIYLLSEKEAIPAVVQGLTKDVQTSSYTSIREMFGDYESMTFKEAWTLTADEVFTIYRFEGTFTDIQDHPEIRLVFNKDSKLSGFWIKPWEDDLQGNL